MRILLLLIALSLTMQVQSQDNNFLVELDAFNPDAAQMIRMMEGNPAEYFDQVDLNGQEQKFDETSNSIQLIWFWSPRDPVCIEQISGMNLMFQNFKDHIRMTSFAYEAQSELQEFLATIHLDIPVVPNSLRIGELLYGSELKMGRIFLIDKKGIVQKALPRQFFVDNHNSFNHLRSFIQKLIEENR